MPYGIQNKDGSLISHCKFCDAYTLYDNDCPQCGWYQGLVLCTEPISKKSVIADKEEKSNWQVFDRKCQWFICTFLITTIIISIPSFVFINGWISAVVPNVIGLLSGWIVSRRIK